jgi:hypothetical protein
VSVLVTGKYPLPFHRFSLATLRHAMRVRLYTGGMTDVYPSFLS